MTFNPQLSRRRMLHMGAALAVGAGFSRFSWAHEGHEHHAPEVAPASGFDLSGNTWALPEPRKIRLATNLNAICLAPVAVADSQGFFKQHNLDVEFVNFGNSTEVLLESLATGKADAATGMALRWLKPLEQGFDVKLTAGTHGGCLRLIGSSDGPQDFAALKGKTIGVTDMASPDKNFFSLMLKRHGVDPNRDVEWRLYPADLLGTALEKGEIQAASGSDPMMYRLRDQPGKREIATNMVDEYANLSCCVIGVGGKLARDDKPAAAAITHAILQAHAWAAKNPQVVAELFQKQALNTSVEEIRSILGEHTHSHYSVGKAFEAEMAVYARDLKNIEVLRASTEPFQFAESIHADVFS